MASGPAGEDPPEVVTTTGTIPGAAAGGTTTVNSVAESTVTLAALPPNVTLHGDEKSWPAMVTLVPPVVGPTGGVMSWIVGPVT